jgi:hypothetical protein
MEFPFHSVVRSLTDGTKRAYKDLLTGTEYPYKKSSSTDGTDEKAVAFASLTAAQSTVINNLVNSGHLPSKPVAKYTVEECRAAYARSIA